APAAASCGSGPPEPSTLARSTAGCAGEARPRTRPPSTYVFRFRPPAASLPSASACSSSVDATVTERPPRHALCRGGSSQFGARERSALLEHRLRVVAEVPRHARVVAEADGRSLLERASIALEGYALKRAVQVPTITRLRADRHLQ